MHLRTRIGIVPLAALLLLLASVLCAQETRRLMVFYEVLPQAELSRREAILLYESLLIDLSDAGERMAVKEYGGEQVPASDEARNAAAERLAADSWLHVGVSGNPGLLRLEVRALDMLSGRTILQQSMKKEMLRGVRDLQRGFWSELSAALAEYFTSAISMDMNRGTLVFEGLPGTLIRGSAWKRLRLDEQGRVSIPVPLPATLPYRATRAGFLPEEGHVYMDQTRKVVLLQQEQGVRLAVDVYLNNLSYPGASLNYFFVPDTVFGRIGVLSYLIGLQLDDSEEGSGGIFTSHSLSNLGMSFGVFLNAPDRDFRPYFALGAAWRFVTARGYWGLEPVSPFALQPLLGCEYARSRKVKVFAEYAPYFYWAPDKDLFALSLPLDRNPRFLFFPPRKDPVDWAVVWEIFLFNVGVRFRL